MKKQLIITFALVASLSFGASMVSAVTITYKDTWVNWPGYTSDLGDTNGTPLVSSMDVTIVDNGGTNYLEKVEIFLATNQFQSFDSLFISTDGAWDSWDYFVHDGGDSHSSYTTGTLPGNGLWTVIDENDYDYTFVKDKNRIGNPNGIDASSLTGREDFMVSHQNYAITYDFSSFGISIDIGSFFIAYAPWCANDIIGGGSAPVPEPATMLLFGTGLIGLAGVARRRNKKKA